MRVAIIGVGSIGGIILGAMADTDVDIVCVSRGSTAKNLSDLGLVLHTPEGSIEVVPSERYLLVIVGQKIFLNRLGAPVILQ